MDASLVTQSELPDAAEDGSGYKDYSRINLKTKAQGCGKKPYQKPNFRVYGDIRTMTQASMVGSRSDGPGPPGQHKTV
jgi:hypothetical protein